MMDLYMNLHLEKGQVPKAIHRKKTMSSWFSLSDPLPNIVQPFFHSKSKGSPHGGGKVKNFQNILIAQMKRLEAQNAKRKRPHN